MPQELTDLTPDEIKAFRAILGKSQTAFGEMLGISLPGVQKWEKVGAPGYWRYVFAAINAGIQPWSINDEDIMRAHLPEALQALKSRELYVVNIDAPKMEGSRRPIWPAKLFYSKLAVTDGQFTIFCNGRPLIAFADL